MRDADKVGSLPARTEKLFDAIDAGFFSGDTFHNEEALKRFEWWIARWQREAINIRAMLSEWSEPSVAPLTAAQIAYYSDPDGDIVGYDGA